MRYLRTNTACRITVGPFFDKTDGVTPETALTVTSCKLTFMVDDGNVPTLVLDTNPTASGGANDMVHVTGDDAGFYDLELAAGNVNYLGRAMLAITDAATHCPVFHEFMIVPAVVYDAMILGTDLLDVSMTQILGTAVSTPATAGILDVNVKNIDNDAASASGTVTFPNATLASTTNITAGTITTATNVTTVNGLAAGVITATSIAADAITAAKVASDVSAEIADQVWDENLAGHQTVLSAGRALTLAGVPLAETTAAGTPTTTTLDLTAGSAVDDFYNDLMILPVSGALAGQSRIITDYTGATKTITVDEPWTSAISAGDAVVVVPKHTHTKNQIRDSILADSTPFNGAAIASILADTNELQTDWVNGGRLDLLLDATLADTNELQTDWVNGGRLDLILDARASQTSVDTIDNNVDAILVDTNELQTDWVNGGRLDLILDARASQASVDTVDGIVDAILVDTAEIGAAGAGLTAVPWNVSWDAEVQSEVADALTDVGLTTTITGRIDVAVSTRLASASYTVPLDAAATRAAIGLASANLDTQLDALPTATENADALLDRAAGVETNRTLRQTLRLMAAVLLGKVSGAATTTNTFRDTNDTVNRVTATVDSDGNRTSITYDAS